MAVVAGLVLCEQPAFAAGLAADEVEMQLRAVGLNFRDVLLVLGEYPGPPEPPGRYAARVLSPIHTRTTSEPSSLCAQ